MSRLVLRLSRIVSLAVAMATLFEKKLVEWRESPALFVRECFGVVPDAWQEDVLNNFRRNQRIAMCASKGVGKAQPKSMWLDTPAGRVKWGDLSVGDYVFAPDGTATKILSVHDRGILPTYRVYFNDGSFTECCGDHLWVVRGQNERKRVSYWQDKSCNWVTLSTEEIIKRGVRTKNGRWEGRQFEIPRHEAVQFLYSRQLIDSYVMGVWLGDGTAADGRVTCFDNEVWDDISNRGYLIAPVNKRNARTIYGIKAELRAMGLLNVNSPNRWIPDCYKYASIQQRTDLLCGLMDTDGFVGKDNGSLEYSTTSKRLADDVVWLVRSLGGVAAIKDAVKKSFYYGKDGEKIAGKDCYRVTIRVNFCPFYIKRKAKRWIHADNPSKQRYLKRYIDRIEKIGEQDVMCITVDHPSHCYLTNDFIVTHNSCLEAWLIWNFLLTRPMPKIAVTSITSDNLSNGLWAELAYWMTKSPILNSLFTFTKTRIFSKEYSETWFCAARSWSKSASPSEIGNTLAGLHADYIMFVLDESGAMPDAIMASAEAALSSCVEGHIVQAGNPTHLEGPLYRACTSERNLWRVTNISSDPDDPKRSARVSIKWANEQIEKYGKDNPWVLVNVFGRFPSASLNALIGPDEVKVAMARYYRESEYHKSAKIMGIDVARSGGDQTVISKRQGLVLHPQVKMRNVDGTRGADMAARHWVEWDADACFIDDTGGFGSSWIDNLTRIGYAPNGVHFNSQASNPLRFANKRAEMAFEFVEWIKKGGALPDDNNLLLALTQTCYTFKGDKLMLEPKDIVREKLGFSPDEFDSAILTMQNVGKKEDDMAHPAMQPKTHKSTFDPFLQLRAKNRF
ncbi:MAG: hypothetical protein KGJ90_05015 [Patescibacteria group bacterium]|nr:hypothetical protein [Patescibacteria group bacterium]